MEEKKDFMLELRCILCDFGPTLELGRESVVVDVVEVDFCDFDDLGDKTCGPTSERMLWHDTNWSFQSGLWLPFESASRTLPHPAFAIPVTVSLTSSCRYAARVPLVTLTAAVSRPISGKCPIS